MGKGGYGHNLEVHCDVVVRYLVYICDFLMPPGGVSAHR